MTRSQEQAAPLIFIMGPTAAGKTRFSLALAGKLKEASGLKVKIVTADSISLYRELVIGSARPTEAEMARVPHELIGSFSVKDDVTLGEYYRRSVGSIQQDPNTVVLVVGGSGFYIQGIENGLLPVPKASDEMRKKLEQEADTLGIAAMYSKLHDRDPEAAKAIAPQDRYRVLRALEIMSTMPDGENLTSLRVRDRVRAQAHLATAFPGRKVVRAVLTCDPEFQAELIAKRTQAMLADGLRDEVRSLKEVWHRPALKSVGYAETITALQTSQTDAQLIEAINQGTRRLAKKQRTWFSRYRKDPKSMFFDVENTEILEFVSAVQEKLTV